MSFSKSSLPIELRDMIVDFLYDDYPTLKICSVVSRCWLESSRAHLFRTIRVSETRGESDKKFHLFQQFASRDENAQKYIKELVLVGREPPEVYKRHTDHEPLTAAFVASILLHLRYLRVLKISRVRLGESPLDHLPTSFEPMPLDTLQLESIGSDYDKLPSYLSILSLFSTIREFRQGYLRCGWDIRRLQLALVVDEDIQDVVKSAEDAIPSHLAIESIAIDSEALYPAILCEIIRKTRSKHTLKSIDVYGETHQDLNSLAALLSDVASNLTHITFAPSSVILHWEGPVSCDYWRMFKFSECVSLQTLTLTLAMEDSLVMYMNYNQALSDGAFDILTLIPNTLRELTFDLNPHLLTDPKLLGDASNFDWDRLQLVLRRFKSLKRLVFAYRDVSDASPDSDGLISELESVVRRCVSDEALNGHLVVRRYHNLFSE